MLNIECRIMKRACSLCIALLFILSSTAQELNCRVSIDYSQIQGTNTDVFTTLENALTSFINERRWTTDTYAQNEKISCSILMTVREYSNDGTFKVELTVQSSRPVYASSYVSPLFNIRDTEVAFRYQEFDRLEFRQEQIETGLTAIIAYYAYTIIGYDLDSYSPMGGTEVFNQAEQIVAAAQSWSETGWKAFDNTRNRHALLTDYVSENMKPYRQAIYDYHRLGLDTMSDRPNDARAKINAAIEEVQQAARANTMSALPQLFTEAKRDELIGIYSKAPDSERDKAYEILSFLNGQTYKHGLINVDGKKN